MFKVWRKIDFLILYTGNFEEMVPFSAIKCNKLIDDDEKLPTFWLIGTEIWKIGQCSRKLCPFESNFKHFTNKKYQLTVLSRKKVFSKQPIDQCSKFLSLLLSICSHLSDYAKTLAIFTSSDIKLLHLMAENGTISSKFPVHKNKKSIFSKFWTWNIFTLS